MKSDKGADAGSAIKSENSAALELRSTVGHASPAASREQTRTADASSAMPSGTMSDAASSAADKQSASGASEAGNADVKPTDVKPLDVKPADTKVEAEAIRAEALKDTAKTVEPKAAGKPAEPVKAGADLPGHSFHRCEKRSGALAGADKLVAAKPEPAKRTGQIAVFVSRKDSKLYVRQNFAPLFEAPVTIAPSDRPLGTHVFTAEADKNDANTVALVGGFAAGRRATRARRRRRTRLAAPEDRRACVEAKPVPTPDSPAEALDRITIPPDAMARITDALSTRRLDHRLRSGHQRTARPAKAPISSSRCADRGASSDGSGP